MSIRALDYLPPLHLTYPDFLSALLTADREIEPTDSYGYREVLIRSFAGYGIAPAASKGKGGCWDDPFNEEKLKYGYSNHEDMTRDPEALVRFIWENRHVLELNEQAYTKVISVRPVLRLGPSGRRLRETVAEYTQLLDVKISELKSLDIPRPRGYHSNDEVRLLGGGALIFNDYGKLKFHVGQGVASKRQKARLEAMARHGEEEDFGARRFVSLHLRRAMTAHLDISPGKE
jgi:hypothetical protein